MIKKLVLSLVIAQSGFCAFAQNSAISVSEYKERALEYSKQYKQAEQQRIATEAGVKSAKSAFLPQIDAAGSYQYRINKYDMALGGASVPMAHDSYSAEIGAVQSIYAGGAIYNSYKASQLQNDIAIESQKLTKDNVLYSADVLYWSTAARKEMYEIMTEYVQIIQQTYDLIAERFNDGLISKTDLLQVSSRLQEAQLQKVNALKAYQLSLENFNVLIGNNPSAPVALGDSITTAVVMPMEVGVTSAYSNRPEMKISDLQISLADRQVNLAKSKYLPNVAIGFKQTWGTTMINVSGETMWNSIAYASVQVPIFHWGGRLQNVRAAKAQKIAQELGYEITRDQVTNEVSNAWTNLQENTRLVDVASQTVNIAQENLDINTFSYAEGRLTILDVLQSQLTWIQAYTNLVNSHLQQKVSIADYQKAVGVNNY